MYCVLSVYSCNYLQWGCNFYAFTITLKTQFDILKRAIKVCSPRKISLHEKLDDCLFCIAFSFTYDDDDDERRSAGGNGRCKYKKSYYACNFVVSSFKKWEFPFSSAQAKQKQTILFIWDGIHLLLLLLFSFVLLTFRLYL